METINGCAVVPASETPEPVHFGPAESGGAYVVIVGTHTVWNSGDRPVRGLILVSPGDAEHAFVPVEAG